MRRMTSRDDLGWTAFFEPHYSPHRDRGLAVARVVLASRGQYHLDGLGTDSQRPRVGELAGRLRPDPDAPDPTAGERLPAIGDWVVFEPQTGDGPVRIVEVLPRRSCLRRKEAGNRARQQVVAANVDTVFVVMGLDGDYNPRRLERFLTMIWDSGARPVVLLNKSDLCAEGAERQHEPGEEEHQRERALAAEGLESYLAPGQTVVLVGSSGVGKSTLVNRLAGRDILRTGAVRGGDDRGRHTTTHRQLVRLSEGALLIDNPGIRELQLWAGDEGLGQAFDDIHQLAEACHYRDCRHHDEPGCAVRGAVETGDLDSARLANLHALEREQRHLELRLDEHARRKERKRVAAIHKAAKRHKPRSR